MLWSLIGLFFLLGGIVVMVVCACAVYYVGKWITLLLMDIFNKNERIEDGSKRQ